MNVTANNTHLTYTEKCAIKRFVTKGDTPQIIFRLIRDMPKETIVLLVSLPVAEDGLDGMHWAVVAFADSILFAIH